MKKTILLINIFGFLILILVLFYFRNIYIPKGTLRNAVYQNQILNENYIMCKRARVTGFDWCIIQDENGDKDYDFCNIVGADPFSELNFNHNFIMADNTYIFYVDNVEFVYSESVNKKTRLYHVTGWDIAYPIKRESIFDFLYSKKYILAKDCQ